MPDPFIDLKTGLVDGGEKVMTKEERAIELKQMGLEEIDGGFRKIKAEGEPQGEPLEKPEAQLVKPDVKPEPEPKPESKPKERTFEDIANLMYGKPEEKGTEFPSKAEEPTKQEDRTFDKLAESVYPTKNSLYADVDEHGNVSAVIRHIETGQILAKSRYGERADLVSRSPLPFADLRGLKLNGRSMDHGNFHDASIADANCEGLSATWANLQGVDAKGTNLSKANLGFSDLRGMKLSAETDISKANFNGAVIDKATYDSLVLCTGSSSAKGLAVRAMPPARR